MRKYMTEYQIQNCIFIVNLIYKFLAFRSTLMAIDMMKIGTRKQFYCSNKMKKCNYLKPIKHE